MPIALTVMGVAAVGSAVIGVMGAEANHAATKRAMGAEKYRANQQALMGEEQQRFNELKIHTDYLVSYNQILENATRVYDTQLVSAAYQGRTISSLRNVQAGDKKDFEYDKLKLELHRDMQTAAVKLDNNMKNIGLERDRESADAAITSSRYARNNQMIGEVFSLGTSLAGMQLKYGKGSGGGNDTIQAQTTGKGTS
jgi:hypothetical protein